MQSQDTLWLLWRLTGVTVHVVAATLDSWVTYRSIASTNAPPYAPWKFLTFWCLCTQLLTYLVCIVCDFFTANYTREPVLSEPFSEHNPSSISNADTCSSCRCFCSRTKRIVQSMIWVRDTLVLSLAFPLAIFVTAMFWTLFAINPSLVVTPDYERNVPAVVNHIQHTLIAVFIVAELLVCHHRLPSFRLRTAALLTYLSLYSIWIFTLGFVLHSWPYPIFEKLPWWGSILFIGAAGVSMYAVQFVGIKVSQYYWTKKRTDNFYRSHAENYSLSRRQQQQQPYCHAVSTFS